MPDKRRHRGRHPEDSELFAEAWLPNLRTAVSEYSWLLTRAYPVDAALKLVGDHYGLTVRQRMAVRRSACSDQSLDVRRAGCTAADGVAGKPVAIDGYNLLITVESALSGGLILVGRDGCYRDLASLHGTYRKVEETIPALELILEHLAGLGAASVEWYLDRPVANSGRLKVLITELAAARCDQRPAEPVWRVQVVPSPDHLLRSFAGLVVSSDAGILDKCEAWTNLAAEIIDARISKAWKIDLRPDGDTGPFGRHPSPADYPN